MAQAPAFGASTAGLGGQLLVEREAALSTLRQRWADAEIRGHVALVAGEAGVGKTSVLRQLAQSSDAVWWGACDALQTPQPLSPLLDIARQHDTRFAQCLGGARSALFEAVLDDLRLAAQPLLVVMEDVHWGDEATFDLIKFLGRRIARARALLVVSFRDDEVPMSHPLRRVLGELPLADHTRVQLQPLSPAGVETLARRSLRSPDGLFAVTQGNPFFLAELLRHPADKIPESVQNLVLARFARLDRGAQDVVRTVSIVPGGLALRLLDRLLPPTLGYREAAIDSGLLVAKGSWIGFRHELARAAVESALSVPAGQALHARMLLALTADPDASAARLAHHAALAGDEQAVRHYAPAAAQYARQCGAIRESARHLRIALRQGGVRAGEQRWCWLENYAIDSGNVDEHEEAVAARLELDAAYRASGNTAREAANLSRLALLHVHMMRNEAADAASRRAIELLESSAPGPALAMAYGVEASLRMLNRDAQESVAWSRQSIALAEQQGDRERLCYSLSTLGTALMLVDYEAGCRQMLEALQLARTQGLPAAVANALVNLGSGSGELMHLPQATQWLSEAMGHALEHELDAPLHYASAWLALCDVRAGRWNEAAEVAGRIAALPHTAAITRVMALVALGRLRQLRGDTGGDAALDEALRLALPAGTLQRIAPVRAARAEAAFGRGDLARASAEAGAALPLAIEKRHGWFIGELAFWSWRAGALTAAPDGCAEPYAMQIAGQWQPAAAAWGRLGCPLEQARALADGDAPARRQALCIFERLGASPATESLRKQLQADGVRGIKRGVRATTRAHPHGLTHRELEVLTLLCEGLRNAEIAQRLCRSVRTVDHHLAAVFIKLDVDSRWAAIQVGQRAGLGHQSGQPPGAI